MENCLNHCADLLTASSVSSCTEYLNHRCQPQCNSCECGGQCYFINLHTYAILKKLCRKVVKDYNRAQCREKYKVFDGGNSVNIRVHRPGSRGDSYSDFNGDDKTNRHKDKKDSDGKSKGRGMGEGDSQYYDKRRKDKSGRDKGDSSYTDKDRESKKKGGSDRKKDGTIDDVDDKRRKHKDGTIDDVDDKRRKHKSKRDQGDSTYTDKDQESKKKSGSDRKKGNRKQDGSMDDIDDQDSKKKSGRDRKKGKGGRNGAFDDVDDKSTAGKDGLKSKDGRRRRKSKTSKEDYDDSTGGKSGSKSKGSRFGKGKDSFSSENTRDALNKSKKGCILIEQARKLKHSRADEVKACDYLRALMEQKEMCQMICSTQCNPCVPCVPCNGVTCNPCAYTCPKAPCCAPYPNCWRN